MTRADSSRQARSGRYGWYVCVVMMLTLAFNYMDRTVIAVVVGPIEREFGASDTVIGFLQGAAFATFYVLFALPLARIADRSNRRNLLLTGALIWCAATVLSGLTLSITGLFAARILVAVGEAVVMPCAVSILSDYFGPEQRTRALSFYSIGIYLGAAMALGGGGFLLRSMGSATLTLPAVGTLNAWRLVFVSVGCLGFILIPLLLAVREPNRLRDDGGAAEEPPSIRLVWLEFQRKRAAILATVVGFAFISLAGSTMQAWAPTLFVRAHGWAAGTAGIRLGSLTFVLGPLGAIVGALAAEFLARRGHTDSKLIIGAISAAVSVIASIATVLTSPALATIGIACLNVLLGFNFGLTQAALTDLMPNRMRAVTSALWIIVTNLFSATFGPLMVGVLNDRVFHDPMRIPLSIAIVILPAFMLAATVLWTGRPALRAAMALRSMIQH